VLFRYDLRALATHPRSRPRWRNGCSVLLALGLCAGLATPSSTQAAEDPPAGYAVTAWTIKDGLTSDDIRAIAQDTDGYLWLGTRDGLIRFDGFEFVTGAGGDTPLQGTVVSTLVGTRDGSLWAGFFDAPGLSRLRRGLVTHYGVANGLPAGLINALLEDSDGTLWAGALGGLAMFRQGGWQRIGNDGGLPTASVFSLYEDHKGTLFVGTAQGIFHRRKGDNVFRLYDGSSTSAQSFAADRTGAIWVTESRTVVRQVGPTANGASGRVLHLPGPARELLFDRRGVLWAAGSGEGLFRINQAVTDGSPAVERLLDQRMVDGAARSLFEDRDGNLWVGVQGGGLVRLSESAIKTNLRLEGHTTDGLRALASTPDGSIWVGTAHSLNEVSGGRTRAHPVDDTFALHTDRNGTLWVMTPRGLGRMTSGQFTAVPSPPGVRLERVFSFTSDTSGALWLCSYDEGLLRWHNGTLGRIGDGTVIDRRPCNYIFSDNRDRIWLGFTTGDVAVYEQGDIRLVRVEDGLASGSVVAIYQDQREAMWVATVNGLTRIVDRQVITADRRNGLTGRIVPSLTEDNRGNMWLGNESGAKLVRFAPSEFDKIAADPSHQLSYTAYDESDGLLGPLPRWGRPSAVRGRDGQLWVLSGRAIAVVDPAQPAVARSAPSPRIERVAIDGRDLALASDFVLPPSTRTLQVDYGAISLSSASKVRFRYKLEGFSNDWVDAGSRRQVTYTNLDPGEYRFHVGVTSDGAWTDMATVMAFTVQPPFHRTPWFYALVIAVTGLGAWGLWWMRLRAIRHEYAVVIAERSRVSREIHDTLLQSLGALTMQLEIVARHLEPSQNKAHEVLQRLRKNLAVCVRDARRSVWELRSMRLEKCNLAQALEEMARETMVALPVSIRVNVTGKLRQCRPDLEQHLLRVAQEAISNAVQHGRATEVVVELDYRGRSLSMSVRDNGCGFVPDAPPADAGEHWGLINMRERVTRAGGKLDVTSVLGQGTTVTAESPI
jgi:signal transduction histidine kinase/ligand-binding sensor domain-containing protein